MWTLWLSPLSLVRVLLNRGVNDSYRQSVVFTILQQNRTQETSFYFFIMDHHCTEGRHPSLATPLGCLCCLLLSCPEQLLVCTCLSQCCVRTELPLLVRHLACLLTGHNGTWWHDHTLQLSRHLHLLILQTQHTVSTMWSAEHWQHDIVKITRCPQTAFHTRSAQWSAQHCQYNARSAQRSQHMLSANSITNTVSTMQSAYRALYYQQSRFKHYPHNQCVQIYLSRCPLPFPW